MVRPPRSSWVASGVVLLLYATHSFAGLAYEVVWIKLLTAALGTSLPALGVVLATFLAGLSLGSFAFSYLRNVSSPFAVVALTQIGIGLLGMAFPFMLTVADQVYVAFASPVDGLPHVLIRCAVTGILLLPIAGLIGMSFPLLAGILATLSSRRPSERPGLAYFVGLLASGAGALAVLGLIPAFGLAETSTLLGMLNLCAALGAILTGRFLSQAQPEVGIAAPLRHHDRLVQLRRPVLALGSLVGFQLIAMELIGAQYLWLIMNSTAYAEGILFAALLLGMAVGAGLYLWLKQVGVSARRLLVISLGGAALAQAALIPLATEIARAFEWLVQTATLPFWTANGALAVAVLGGPAIGCGLAFCCLCELVLPESTATAHASTAAIAAPIGRLYAWHNVGAVAGALLTTFALIPTIGLTKTLAVVTAVPLASLVWFWRPFRWVGVAAAIPALGVLIWLGTAGDLTFRRAAAGEANTVIFHHEDGQGVVEVFEDRQVGARALLTSRLRQEGGSRPEDLQVQRIQGYLPLLLHPAPKKVLVVGLGTGITLSPTLRNEVEQVTVVEISRGILDAAPLFARENGGVLAHPKVSAVEQDGRNFIKLTRQRYDLIVQELFFPYQAGVGNLYTREHYLRCRDRLAPGGMMAQWISINQVGLEDLRSLVRTFHQVFPHTTLWLNGGYLLLFGSVDQLAIDLPTFLQRFEAPDPLGGIARLMADPFDFLSMFLTHGPALQTWAAGAPINTDDNAFIEYHVPLAFASLNSVELAGRNLGALIPLHQPVTEVVQTRGPLHQTHARQLARASEAAQLLREGIVARAHGRDDQARDLYSRAFQLNPANHQVRTFLEKEWAARGRALLLSGQDNAATEWLAQAVALNRSNPDVLFDLAVAHARQGEHQKAVQLYRELLQAYASPGGSNRSAWSGLASARFNLGASLYRLEDYREAARLFAEVTQQEPLLVDAHFNLANSLAQTGAYLEAAKHYRMTLQLEPHHEEARRNMDEVTRWVNGQQ